MAHPLWLIVFTIGVALVPIAVGMITSYLKVSIVLSMLRSGLGTQQVPSNLVVMALAFAMSIFIMSPTLEQTKEIGSKIDFNMLTSQPNQAALARLQPLYEPWREFMARHVGKRELAAFVSLSEKTPATLETTKEINGVAPNLPQSLPATEDIDSTQVSARVLIPAFVLSEIKEAFAMAFVVLLPFLVVDLVVANILAGLGMYMVSPVMIALPLKLLLFVVSDGWLLLTRGLIGSYSMGA